jgi:hypothetical protein
VLMNGVCLEAEEVLACVDAGSLNALSLFVGWVESLRGGIDVKNIG